VETFSRPRAAPATLAAAVSQLCGGQPAAWQSLLDANGGLQRIADGRAVYVARQAGLTAAQARRFAALVDVVREAGAEPLRPGTALRGSTDVYAHFRPLAPDRVETFHAVLLDQKHRVLRTVEISRGTLTASLVHPREVYRPVILEAAAVIFVHNHPSGDPTPSKEDLEITRCLREVGDLVGVRVLDHVIIGCGRYCSFVDDGYW
jgi:DNA repair protein RadC